MAISTLDRNRRWIAHPMQLALVAGAFPLFLGALIADATYVRSFEAQWKNFASWLITGALVFAGIALLLAIVELARRRGGKLTLHAVALAATFAIGFVNALVHAKDGWASMPTATILSVIVAILSAIAAALALSTVSAGGRR